MAEQLTRLEINCETGEQTIIPLTEEEIAIAIKTGEQWAEQQAALLAEKEAKEMAKASALVKLATLGLTEEEANALIS
jgi:hypothetical protein